MNNNIPNASNFIGTQTFSNGEFESLLGCCVGIYNEFIGNNLRCDGEEEKIRDVFFDKLNDDVYRENHPILQYYHFEKEPQENTGFLDIKVKTLNPYGSTKAYYCIECKKLGVDNKGYTTGLNIEYVKDGICCFVNDYYSSYFGRNVMFGFLVNKVCVQTEIIDSINSKLNKDYINTQGVTVNANGKTGLQYVDFAEGYPYSFVSTHTHITGSELVLYHLMFDFSNNII